MAFRLFGLMYLLFGMMYLVFEMMDLVFGIVFLVFGKINLVPPCVCIFRKIVRWLEKCTPLPLVTMLSNMSCVYVLLKDRN